MKAIFVSLFGFVLAAPLCAQVTLKPFRPPAVPLVTFDPYLSIWSENDQLNGGVTRHWTRAVHPLSGYVRVDGKSYLFMGDAPKGTSKIAQTSVRVGATQTRYRFDGAGIEFDLTFTTTALPADLKAFSRPLSYVDWRASSADGRAHQVQVFLGAGSELAVNQGTDPVILDRAKTGEEWVLRAGSQAQTVFQPAGDDTRMNWGHTFLAGNRRQSSSAIGSLEFLVDQFNRTGGVRGISNQAGPLTPKLSSPTLALAFDLGSVMQQGVSRHAVIGYDQEQAIRWFGHPLKPFWRLQFPNLDSLLLASERDHASLMGRCLAFDQELRQDLVKAGGLRYADITTLSYRQAAAACGLVADEAGQPLYLTKENTSNGDLDTVDVLFPMAPVWLMLSPTLSKATIAGLMQYSISDHWKFANAPHDLGTYPIADGRDDGGEQMPVEETGNLLILCDAIAHAEGNPKFAMRWWPTLTQWANFLVQYGLDPEDQLCTDDFMGHLAHNTNLSVKAILALAAYGDLCKMKGDTLGAARYAAIAKADAKHWMEVANDGDHYRLAFDKPHSWSQMYNMVWDRLLGLNVFPADVSQKEVAFYLKNMQPYGLPLDSRTHLTKTDWQLWTATLSDSPTDFEKFVSPIYDYLDQTTTRDPISDSYMTDDVKSGGMHARPVVGGLFVKALADPALWHKWASRDRYVTGQWAPIPPKPVVTMLVPTEQTWSYTFTPPTGDWTSPNFDDSKWATGQAGFGEAPDLISHSKWSSSDIWIRRKVKLPQRSLVGAKLWVYHDEDIEVSIDGEPALSLPGYENDYHAETIAPRAAAKLKPGATVVIAAHCHQTDGGQGIDVGLATVRIR